MSLGLAVLLWALVPAAAAGQAEAPAPGGGMWEPEVLLAPVDPEEGFSAWRGLRLRYAVVNGAAPAGIGVKSLKLSVPPALGVRAAGPAPRAGGLELIPEAFQLRSPRERRDFPPVELAPARLRELGWGIVSVMLYRPRKELFAATLEYEQLADGGVASRSAILVVPVAAHPLAMYLGAVLGSLLAALYFALPPLRRGKEAPAPAPGASSLRELAIRFVRGALVMGLAVFLLQMTQDLALPIKVTVHDFSGGVLLGLFGDRVGEAIGRKLWG